MRDKVQGFKPRLRDQRAVERVAMVVWQASHLSSVLKSERQGVKATLQRRVAYLVYVCRDLAEA
jgi:hypothetical protein